jgi:hypothetical protein
MKKTWSLPSRNRWSDVSKSKYNLIRDGPDKGPVSRLFRQSDLTARLSSVILLSRNASPILPAFANPFIPCSQHQAAFLSIPPLPFCDTLPSTMLGTKEELNTSFLAQRFHFGLNLLYFFFLSFFFKLFFLYMG